ncbi:MAG: hypothetical protein Kow0092_30600 [Deferrisomatales bacterium]
MAQRARCNHAYGLRIVHCPECGSHIASRCPDCDYESRYDDEHRPGCSLAAALADPGGSEKAAAGSEPAERGRA